MKRSMPIQLAAALMILVTASVARAAWSSAPAPTATVGSNFDNAALQRYVAPGQEINVLVASVSDTDTEDCNPPVADSQVAAEMKKSGGTVEGNWTSGAITGRVYTSYTVPAGATAGQTVQLQLRIHDTRAAEDLRHDEWSTVKTWNFTVRTAVPTLAVDNTTDTTGAVPVNQTLGKATVRMVAGGDPPEGKENWDGTVFTEALGNIAGNKDHLVTAAEFLVGLHPNAGDDSSFTAGTAAVNKFNDFLNIAVSIYILEAGVNSTSLTHVHDYGCTEASQYDFTGTYEMVKQAGPRVKGNLSLAATE